jgi:hypothetical protein
LGVINIYIKSKRQIEEEEITSNEMWRIKKKKNGF